MKLQFDQKKDKTADQEWLRVVPENIQDRIIQRCNALRKLHEGLREHNDV